MIQYKDVWHTCKRVKNICKKIWTEDIVDEIIVEHVPNQMRNKYKVLSNSKSFKRINMKNKTVLTHTYTSENKSPSVLSETLLTPQTIQSMELSRPEQWSGSTFPYPGYLPNPGIKPRSPALQEDSLPAEPPGKTTHTPRHI